MSGQNTSQTFANNAETTGQAQTGEQMKNIAQGAADAVKNTLGMNKPTSTDHPSNPSPPRT
ncbi:hypothetical protein Gohar_023316 [Gossypium harknessii]|uniref:Uncharacterized protein n=2 Tax=Gossypium TaxID=3633 RepID=A0A7J8MKN1_9ROSI|nr:hypothetical protein [Gossypium lobatum]MBA0807513.1 hypothetical protein [Gossypium harknessii]